MLSKTPLDQLHLANTHISQWRTLKRDEEVNRKRNASSSPVLAHEADVEFAPLQVFTGVTHDLVEGVLQEVVPAYDEPESKHTHKNTDVLDLRWWRGSHHMKN